jgi:DNA-binding beta-propeller fold protein YncE
VPITSDPCSSRARVAVAKAATAALALAFIGAGAGGCGFGESGIAPPTDRFFFPAAVAVDPAGQWLYVVNSNSDLRYNAGTVAAVNLRTAGEDRARKDWPSCPTSSYVPPLSNPARFCCKDFVDQLITNCDERGYVAQQATVRLGSFGGTALVQKVGSGPARRLFVAVRAEPSITYIDLSVTGDKVTMTCSDPSLGGEAAQPNPLCSDAWRIKSGPIQDDGLPLPLQEEPHGLVLDDKLGVMYVAHLGGIERNMRIARGVSVLDVCNPETRKPRLAAGILDALPLTGFLGGITTVVPSQPGNPLAPLYATAELTSDIVAIEYRDPAQVRCDPGVPADRDLGIVAGAAFSSSVYGTRGANLRGLVMPPPGNRAYVLHRAYADRLHSEYNPASVVALDRTPDERGAPRNRPVGLVEVCAGPTELLWHDAGRGPRLFVNCFEGGQIYVVDPVLMVADAIIEAGAGPADLQFSPQNGSVAYLAGFANNNVSVIDLQPGSPTEYRVVQRIGFARSSSQVR